MIDFILASQSFSLSGEGTRHLSPGCHMSLPAVSTRGFGAEGSIWPGGGAWQPGGRRGGGEPADRGQHHLPPRSVHRPPKPRRHRREGAKVQPDAVQGEGAVASEAGAEPKSAVEAGAAAFT